MKKIIAPIFVIGLLLYPVLCFPSYVIHLKDGQEILTDQYWEEGDQIKIKRYGGVIGIGKNRVSGIVEIEEVSKEKDETTDENGLITKGKAGKKEEGNDTGKPAEVNKKGKNKNDQKESIKKYWEQKKALKVQLDSAIKKARDAARNNNFPKRKKMIEEARKISKEIQRLTDEVKQMNNGKLPDFWEN